MSWQVQNHQTPICILQPTICRLYCYGCLGHSFDSHCYKWLRMHWSVYQCSNRNFSFLNYSTWRKSRRYLMLRSYCKFHLTKVVKYCFCLQNFFNWEFNKLCFQYILRVDSRDLYRHKFEDGQERWTTKNLWCTVLKSILISDLQKYHHSQMNGTLIRCVGRLHVG